MSSLKIFTIILPDSLELYLCCSYCWPLLWDAWCSVLETHALLLGWGSWGGASSTRGGVCLTSLIGDLFELIEMGFGLPRLAGMWPPIWGTGRCSKWVPKTWKLGCDVAVASYLWKGTRWVMWVMRPQRLRNWREGIGLWRLRNKVGDSGCAASSWVQSAIRCWDTADKVRVGLAMLQAKVVEGRRCGFWLRDKFWSGLEIWMSEPHWLCIPLGLGLQREGDVVSKLLSGLETLGSAHTFFFLFILALYTRLASHSEICLSQPPKCRD